MPSKRSSSFRSRAFAFSRRTGTVWGVFLAATTVVSGLLAMQSGPARSGFLLTSVENVGNKTTSGGSGGSGGSGVFGSGDSIFQLEKPIDRQRWTGIVIHHLGTPAGDAESVTRDHLKLGYQSLGYHFLIGNGNGLGDGVIHVGDRWIQQQPGAHVFGRTDLAAFHNQHSIAICLIGNGDRRPFTDRQMAQLINLVQRLQAELHIPAKNVYLHRDLVSQTASPGRFFPAAQFKEQLLN